MLQIKPNCECCGLLLPYNAAQAFICTFECTFCENCAKSYDFKCPNCTGNLEKRPLRPKHLLVKYPVATQIYINQKLKK